MEKKNNSELSEKEKRESESMKKIEAAPERFLFFWNLCNEDFLIILCAILYPSMIMHKHEV